MHKLENGSFKVSHASLLHPFLIQFFISKWYFLYKAQNSAHRRSVRTRLLFDDVLPSFGAEIGGHIRSNEWFAGRGKEGALGLEQLNTAAELAFPSPQRRALLHGPFAHLHLTSTHPSFSEYPLQDTSC